jgi:hypothetical protein
MLNETLISLVLMKDDQKFINNKLKYLYNTLEINIFGIEEKETETEKEIEENNYRKLVFHKSVYDDCMEGDVKFRKDSLNITKKFDLVYNHDDICFYIFNKDIYRLLENETIKKKNFLKNDFVPFLINKSYKKILRKLLYGGKRKLSEMENSFDDNLGATKKGNGSIVNKKVDIMAFLLDSEDNYA